MNILLVANGFPPSAFGGVEVYVYQLAKYFSAHNHQVTVFCRESSENLPDHQVIKENVDGMRIIRIVNDHKNTSTFNATFEDPRIEEIYHEVIEDLSPDLVHINHLIALSYRLPLLTRELGIPSIISLHDYWPFCFRVQLVDWMENHCRGPLNGGDCFLCIQGGHGGIRTRATRLVKDLVPYSWRQSIRKKVFRSSSTSYLTNLSQELVNDRYESYRQAILSADKIFTPSRYIKKQYENNGYPGDRFQVVRLGIDIPDSWNNVDEPHYEPAAGQGMRFTFVGTLIPNKGADVLIRAFKRLENKKITLSIYGREDVAPSHYLALLKELAHGDDRIIFKGSFNQEERREVYQNSDVVVIPSRFPETFSIVAHEGLAYGKPIIASDIGAIPEVVIDGKNGMLVPPGDENALYSVLKSVIEEVGVLGKLELPGPINIFSTAEHGEFLQTVYAEVIRINQIS